MIGTGWAAGGIDRTETPHRAGGMPSCIMITPGMISHYWWQGKIERAEEAVMLIKTRASLAEPVTAAVKELHSYTTPAIMVLPVDSLEPDYHRWIVTETSA
jgi:periplasmic divalent cation tolerance protein